MHTARLLLRKAYLYFLHIWLRIASLTRRTVCQETEGGLEEKGEVVPVLNQVPRHEDLSVT
jgi:hypothetical protein